MALVNTRPHALMLPFPSQGHIQAMMQLSKLLYARGFYITFVNTEYIQERLEASGSVDSVKSWPDFRFETLPDGLPPEHGRTSKLAELCRSFADNGPLHFEKLIDKLKHSQPDVPPITCIISDGVVSFPQKTARKLAVPRVSFWTHSACGFCAYFFAPLLVGKGLIPGKDDDRCLTNGCMEQIITCIPGMPPLRVKDLPTSLRHKDMLEIVTSEAQAALEADLVLLNTFDELDRPILDALLKRLPALYTIGPLVLQAESGNDRVSGISASLWTEETGCVEWLDCQKPYSVIYVCFGSVAVMSDQELLELAWGLEASKQPFLWVIRPDLIHGDSAVLPSEFLEKVKDRSFLVKWAPQMKVLTHRSVGGFLTHSGWNSTLESICAGVPMISWPFLAEQPTNRRFVSGVWNIGMAMNEVVRREDVEDMVRRLMSGEEGRRMRKRIGELRDESMRAVGKGGSSYNNTEKFLKEIQMGLIDS
uniref:Glycosyltransferase n=1 Tax=Picea sitchensis TaxID=3332 RepID=B8LQW4_PICSI|nr:unknown [Picea sitchensis]